MKQASLPMYDLPECRKATDAWWSGVSRHMHDAGITDVPTQLQHDIPVNTLWESNDLFLSQCCGFDVIHGYKNTLNTLLVTDWNAEGCLSGEYSSWVVVHEDSPFENISDLYNRTAIINGIESHSGMNSLMPLVQPYSQDGTFFSRIKVSGSHVDSLLAIQQRHADVAAIDCVTYALLKRYRPQALEGICIIGQTASAPAHPLVTTSNTSPHVFIQMQQALEAAFNDSTLDDVREAILLKKGLFGKNEYEKIADNFIYDKRLLDVVQQSI